MPSHPFVPLLASSHLLTILGNFWSRPLDTVRFPVESKLYRTEPDVQVRVDTQWPPQPAPAGDIVMVHGLEGSAESGYMKSLSQAALESGFATHRFHMRTCGGTAHLCKTLYHAGLTSDLLSFLRQLRAQGRPPVCLMGFSLGGNVVLKLAGELGEAGHELLSAVCGVSTPIDLMACAVRLGKPDNFYYERRFLRRMCARLLATGRYQPSDFRGIRSIFEIDDRITAPSFGFEGARHYYATQSSHQFLERIRVPTLVVQARDDTFIPFEIFDHPAFKANSYVHLLATKHGGHLGFLSRRRPRFWVDGVILEWATGHDTSKSQPNPGLSAGRV
ncbi:MAG: YheT family hydrolase [Bryobacteraceae bacterium]